MNIELAYGYFRKLMKSGQGAARGGKYQNRTWKGDHWEYDYGDDGKGNPQAKQEIEKPQKPKTIRADRKYHTTLPENQKKLNAVIEHSLPVKDMGRFSDSQIKQIQERKALIADPKTTSEISKWSKNEYMVTLKNGDKENTFMINTPWNLMDLTNHPLAKKDEPTQPSKIDYDSKEFKDYHKKVDDAIRKSLSAKTGKYLSNSNHSGFVANNPNDLKGVDADDTKDRTELFNGLENGFKDKMSPQEVGEKIATKLIQTGWMP